MIVRCPACGRGYRVDDSLPARRRALRCSACKHQFTLDPRAAGGPAPAAVGTAPRPDPEPRDGTAAGVEDARRRVVLADARRPFGGIVKSLLEELGCSVEVAAEGIDAFRLIVARRPHLLVASLHLPGLSGVAICGGVKGSPHLRSVKVALVGSSPGADRLNRDTALASGADLFLEEEMGAEALRREIASLLARPLPSRGEVSAVGRPGVAADAGDATAGPDAEISALARLMLADLRLYYPERYDQAVRDGRLFEVFSDELSKGRAMLDERYPQVAERHQILAAALKAGTRSLSG
jgi:predicted Zn finger-like uncharacterized protein